MIYSERLSHSLIYQHTRSGFYPRWAALGGRIHRSDTPPTTTVEKKHGKLSILSIKTWWAAYQSAGCFRPAPPTVGRILIVYHGKLKSGSVSHHGIEAVYMYFNGSGIWGGETITKEK